MEIERKREDLKKPWTTNDGRNPFWMARFAVEVELADGSRKIIKCPACTRSINSVVTRWRKHEP